MAGRADCSHFPVPPDLPDFFLNAAIVATPLHASLETTFGQTAKRASWSEPMAVDHNESFADVAVGSRVILHEGFRRGLVSSSFSC